MSHPPIALQLWSVHQETQIDFAKTIRAVALAGYDGVELAGYGNADVDGARRIIESTGLRVAGMHVSSDRLRRELHVVIEEALMLGTRDIVCPWWNPAQFVSGAACEAIATELATWGSVIRSFGLRFSYHNHDGELRMVSGRRVIDWMLEASAPRDLALEPDVYWLHSGGVEPSGFLRRQGARCPLIHLKDAADLGAGPVNFAPILAAIAQIDACEWLVVEQESFQDAPMAAVVRNLNTLRAWLA